MEAAKIMIGYDPRETCAYHVCCESIIARSSMPVEFYPLALPLLRTLYQERHGDGSNAFAYSRFLVPYLNGFQGHALYLDGDMVVKGDIAELWAMRDYLKAVQVVQHDYKTKHPVKYFGAKNENYPRKNWSSVMLWNCSHFANRRLTPEYVASNSGAHLHRFRWLDDERIGPLPLTWNWLVGEYDENPDAKLLHYTLGTPCIEGFHDKDSANACYVELDGALNVAGQASGFLLTQLRNA